MITYTNEDCMELIKRYPDKHFDLAIVDPIYGDVTQGGWNKNPHCADKLAKASNYSVYMESKQNTYRIF